MELARELGCRSSVVGEAPTKSIRSLGTDLLLDQPPPDALLAGTLTNGQGFVSNVLWASTSRN